MAEDEECDAVTVSVAKYWVTIELLLTLESGVGAVEVIEGIAP